MRRILQQCGDPARGKEAGAIPIFWNMRVFLAFRGLEIA